MLFDWAEKNPALTQGLLAAAFGAMAGRGSRTQALGKGGLAGLLGYSNAQGQMANAEKEKEAQKYRQMQMGQLEAQIAQQQKDRDATRSAFAPTSPTQALAGGGGPTPANAERIGQMPQFDPRSMFAAGASPEAVAQAMQINSSLNPAPKLRDVAPGAVLIDEKTGKEVFRAPERENLDSLIVKGPDGRPMLNQLAFDARRQIASAGAPSVSYGAPTPAINPATGEVELMRPDNRGGSKFTGIKPAPQDRDVKLPAELQRMQIAGDTMVGLIDQYEGLLKKHNPRDPMTQFNPSVRADIESVKRNMELQFKELQALGALAGPDIEIMRQSLADPFTFKGAYYGKDGLLAQTRRARELVKMRSDAVLKSQGRTVKPAQADEDPLGLR